MSHPHHSMPRPILSPVHPHTARSRNLLFGSRKRRFDSPLHHPARHVASLPPSPILLVLYPCRHSRLSQNYPHSGPFLFLAVCLSTACFSLSTYPLLVSRHIDLSLHATYSLPHPLPYSHLFFSPASSSREPASRKSRYRHTSSSPSVHASLQKPSKIG